MGCISTTSKYDPKLGGKRPEKKPANKKSLEEEFKPGNYKTITKKYIINPQVLGSGNFGKVFLGTSHSDKNHKCAIKLIDKRAFEEIDLIKQEIMILSQLDHPNISKYYETYESSKNIYLVMEYCGGVDLFDKIVKNKDTFTEQKAARLRARRQTVRTLRSTICTTVGDRIWSFQGSTSEPTPASHLPGRPEPWAPVWKRISRRFLR